MERAELARLLEASGGSGGVGPVMISETDPRKFMAAFTAALAGKNEVFLCDPRWSTQERQQVVALAQVSQPADHGWLLIPTGGTSGEIKFARHDGHTLAAAVRGFTQHFDLRRVNAAGLLPLHHVS